MDPPLSIVTQYTMLIQIESKSKLKISNSLQIPQPLSVTIQGKYT